MRAGEESGKLKEAKENRGPSRTDFLSFVYSAFTDIHTARWRCRSI